MTVWICGRRLALGAIIALSAVVCIQPADAARGRRSTSAHTTVVHASARAIQAGAAAYSRHGRGYSVARYGRIGGGLQCVPFARENSGIELTGNAATWWDNAVGVYERGGRPEVGSVLNFRANGRMRLGHVAVVSRVIDGRNVEIDHANWGGGRGNISRNINVVDVSPQNDWTAVRVALGESEEFGSIYPTYGFIYDRPDRGTMVANSGIIPAPLLNTASRDLRPARERALVSLANDVEEEVAEAADDTQPRSRYAYARSGYSRYAKAGKLSRTPRSAIVQTVSARSVKGQPAAKASHTRRRNAF